MKRIVLIIIAFILLIAPVYTDMNTASAADVVLQVVIKEKHVPRVQEAVQAEETLINCGALNAKLCLEKKIWGDIAAMVLYYEQHRDAKVAADKVVPITKD